MAKLLKHFGIGTGSKKSASGDFQAKTLPPAPAGAKGYSSRRDTIGTGDTSRDGSSRNSSSGNTNGTAERRASHDSYRTMPARGFRTRGEREWSLRGPRSRENSSSVKSHGNCSPSADGEHHSAASGTGSRRRQADQELRRSLTTDEIGLKGSAAAVTRTPPTLGEYSDPFDLKVAVPEAAKSATESSVALPLADDDYSVPYELKDRPTELQTSVTVTDSHVTEAASISLETMDLNLPTTEPSIQEETPEPEPAAVESKTCEEVPELSDYFQPAVDNDVYSSSKYDDPYEENPIALFRQQNIQRPGTIKDTGGILIEKQSPVSLCFNELNTSCSQQVDCSSIGIQSVMLSYPSPSSCDAGVVTDSRQLNGSTSVTSTADVAPKPTRSYELSAEYGGFFVPPMLTASTSVATVCETDKDDDQFCTDYTDLECSAPPIVTTSSKLSSGSVMSHSNSGFRSSGGAMSASPAVPSGGFYDQPWDLSTTQRGLAEKLKQAKQTRDIGVMAVMDSVGAAVPAELYAQPQKGADRSHNQRRVLTENSAEMRSTGPSYGILCQRVAENGMMAPLAVKNVRSASGAAASAAGAGAIKPVNGQQQRVDIRPVEDYDVPWDQKKSICKTATDVGCMSARLPSSSASSQVPSRGYLSLTERDLRQPLDKQSWYHGSISRRDAERLLRGQPEGSYLIRMSESNKLDFSMSVRSINGFMHMKIVANSDGRYILGQFSQPFYSIAQMVNYYTVNKLPIKGAEHICLTHPIKHEVL